MKGHGSSDQGSGSGDARANPGPWHASRCPISLNPKVGFILHSHFTGLLQTSCEKLHSEFQKVNNTHLKRIREVIFIFLINIYYFLFSQC